MPWHDIGVSSSNKVIKYLPFENFQCVVSGKSARDVARHFIQRWNATKV
jgi:phosphatidylserine/phosphatidylglycerophosphate/cardiolipin synthase-like enzyme